MSGFFYKFSKNLKKYETRKRLILETKVRYPSLLIQENILYLIYSSVGDIPEKIVCRKINLDNSDWNKWKAGPEHQLLKAELPWEGSVLKSKKSVKGASVELINELRNPSVFKDEDDKMYLLYSGGGEKGIGIAELKVKTTKKKQYE